jgi:protein phosphatase
MLSLESGVANGIVWSDPRASSTGFEPSDRGSGVFFNSAKLDFFLAANSLKLLVRSHEACAGGFERPFGDDGKCVTVFSTSDYCGIGNSAAVLRVGVAGDIEFEVFQPLTARQREKRTLLIPHWMIDLSCQGRAGMLPVRKLDVSDFLGTIVDDSIRLCSGL